MVSSDGFDVSLSPFETLTVPHNRSLVVDAGFLSAPRHIIYGLVEADVTDALAMRTRLAAQDGHHDKKLSLTAYFAACLARAVAEDPRVQAMKKGRRKIVLFEDVDVVVMVEPEPDAVAVPHVIRNANKKTVREISDEIRSIQARPEESAQSSTGNKSIALAARLPRWLRMLFFRRVLSNPHRTRKYMGTVMLTSIGMFGSGKSGWGVTFLPTHTTGVTVGGIQKKPAVVNGEIVPRDMLSLTIAFDHDVVDGAPAARFVSRLVQEMESASLLQAELSKIEGECD